VSGNAGRSLAIAATAIVVAAVATAIVVMGGPSAQRERRLDERRVQDLARIERGVRAYREQHGRLPRDLATLAQEPGRRLPRDPGTDAGYDYEAVDARRFRMCAEFATDTAQLPEGEESWSDEKWSHPAGRHCFERDAAKREEDR